MNLAGIRKALALAPAPAPAVWAEKPLGEPRSRIKKRQELSGQAATTQPKWTSVRFVLGTLQITGSIVGLSLLIQTGLSEATIWATVLTGFVSVLSVVFFRTRFGARLRRRPENRNAGSEGG